MSGVLARVFRAHGHLCASRPWEVIIGTLILTLFSVSMSFFASNKVCGWNYRCEQPKDDDTKSSDVIVLTLTRSITVVYVYLQFRKLRKLGSKYLLGVAGLFTVFSSVVFSIGVISVFGSDLTGLNEALPFFLLLVDLSKACSLAKFAFSAKTQEEVVVNIGRGMELLGPMLTLDTLVQALVIGVGTLSDVKVLETMCRFGCLSVVANYLAFMTFFPACLALVLELSRGSQPFAQFQQLAAVWQETEEDKPNPVTQRVKIIMSAGLVFVHAHSRLVVGEDSESSDSNSVQMTSVPDMSRNIMPEIPLWQFYIYKLSSMSVDYILTFLLAAILAVKYIAFDRDSTDLSPPPTPNSLAEEHIQQKYMSVMDNKSADTDTAAADQRLVENLKSSETNDCAVEKATGSETSSSKCEHVGTSAVNRQRLKSATFVVGDSSEDSDSESEVYVSTGTQTDKTEAEFQPLTKLEPRAPRPLSECAAILKSEDGAAQLSDEEILALVNSRHIAAYQLESALGDHLRAVSIRRQLIAVSLRNQMALENLPYEHYDYKYVHGSCCENVIGHVPVPVGIVKPLVLDGKRYTVPMATTEGCLVASTNRGCRALELAGGVRSVVTKDGMTRAPVVRFDNATRADEARRWLKDETNYKIVAEAFNGTSRFARLLSVEVKQVAHTLHIRFTSFTGDAMGMNMVSKGCEVALDVMRKEFPDMKVLSLSGNFCTDKKPSAVNWIEGRGKSVVCDAIVPAKVVREVLKTSAAALVDLNVAKNLTGSAIAGSIGGFNAHAANVVTAIYIATGQDPAQNVDSSNCITLMETYGPNDEDLYVSCSMPSIEVGTVGGGTVLPPQAACLEMLGIRGSNPDEPGANARTLARVVCATVMAAELSLMSALTTGDLVKSHLKHNRSVLNMAPTASQSCLPAAMSSAQSNVLLNPSANSASKPLGSCLNS